MVHLRRDVAHVIEALRAKGVLVGRTFPPMVRDLRVSVEAAGRDESIPEGVPGNSRVLNFTGVQEIGRFGDQEALPFFVCCTVPLQVAGHGADFAATLAVYDRSMRYLPAKEIHVGIFDKLGKKEGKPKADFSNVQSGSSTTADEPAAVPPPDLGPVGTTGNTTDTYVVVSGDSLSKIAKRQYGDMNQWRRIYEANRDQIKDPDLIHPGQKLKIPRS